jgi:hypothetical protein
MLSRSRVQGVAHARSPPLTMHNGLLHIIAEVDNVPTQIHSGQLIRRPHHPRVAAAFSTVVNVAASTEPENATDRPFGK